MELKKIDNAGKMLVTLRQRYWSGQAYDLMMDELSSMLLTKWYAEKTQAPFDVDHFESTRTEAEKFFNIELRVGPKDRRLYGAISTLSEYQVRGNPEVSHQMHQAWLKKTHRKELGQYFTPPFIRKFMVGYHRPSPSDVVCDPAGGSGAFLVEAANSLSHFRPTNFIYFDIDRLGAVPTAEKSFFMYEHPVTGQSLDGVTIHQRDALDQKWEVAPDRIYTNVPFGLTVTDQAVLSKFEVGVGKKTQVSQLLFIEKCLKELKDGGTLATVVDRGIATNLGLRADRSLLTKMAHLELVVDLPGKAFEYFAGTSFGTCLLFFRKVGYDTGRKTKFARVFDLGYDEKGYLYGEDPNTRSFDPSDFEPSWERSDFKKILNTLGQLESVNTDDVIDTGDWQWGSYKYRNTKCSKLRDVARLSRIAWDGTNLLNPTVNRKFRSLEETHLSPKKKTNTLVVNSLLFSRLLSEGQPPACGMVTDKWVGAGVTSENHVIVPKDQEALARVWFAINFHKPTQEYLWDMARGQGRGRIKEEDLLNAPLPEQIDLPKVATTLELLKDRAAFDDRVKGLIATLA